MTRRYEFYITGSPLLEVPYLFEGAGLPGVYLCNGVTFRDDPEHGHLVSIKNLPALLQAIAFSVAGRRGPLNGDERRYLRKRIGLSQTALAEKLDIDQQTIANYEKGKSKNTGAADFALKMLVIAKLSPDEQVAERLRLLAAEVITNGEMPETKVTPATRGSWASHECRA